MRERVFAPKHAPIRLALAIGCFAAAAFFRFALLGYSTTALLFAALGVLVLLYLYLPRAAKIVLTALVALGLSIFICAEIPVIRASSGDGDVDADYAIVLGAGVNGAVPSLTMLNRLDAAERYLNAHPDCIAVVSGGMGPGEDITEAEAMASWLLERGISERRIIREEQATSTAENIRYSLALIPEPETRTLAVISSDYHLYRAKLMGEKLGCTLYGVPAKTTLPVLRVNYFLREALGVGHFWVFGD
ncbi:MAG: YdcF family protein [Oscillospiraceae bacterium]|nr:YdcF family protein [Oscillospiraceae bacterium]